MGYTWAQFSHYLRLAGTRRAKDRLADFLALNCAQAAGKAPGAMLDALKADLAAAEAAGD